MHSRIGPIQNGMVYRIRDIILASLGLLFWLVPMLMLMPWMALTQQRIFFAQLRTGYGEKPFRLYKFSTLRDIVPGEREEDDQRKRLTPIGKFLRRFSLDELPQLWNVLKGDMSLVGPRPLIHDYAPLYTPAQRRRFAVKPGITGWAQVQGRNALTFTQRFELDLWYVQHKSIGLDLKIMALTLQNALSGRGVYVNEATTAERFDGSN
jgi:lipopolysaccharide/colanic/teichoic acid biosynthesis glycosyltransferase